jgi:hypothetical protein
MTRQWREPLEPMQMPANSGVESVDNPPHVSAATCGSLCNIELASPFTRIHLHGQCNGQCWVKTAQIYSPSAWVMAESDLGTERLKRHTP